VNQVLVLNASFEPLNVCSLRRAHVLVYKGKAEVVEELDRPLCSAAAKFPWPHVIRLLSYVRVPRIVQRKISRRALFARDGWRCVYCGTSSGRLTLDHVIPRSRGGDSVWENVVTSCAPCNLRKGNRLLHEVAMELPHPPRAPAPVLFIRLAAPKIPARWEQYLAAFGAAA
jgi:5-methylcytosine-specific restriction endonuclease McrA